MSQMNSQKLSLMIVTFFTKQYCYHSNHGRLHVMSSFVSDTGSSLTVSK